jgi:hypothetical protein
MAFFSNHPPSTPPESRSKPSRPLNHSPKQRSQISDRHWPIIYIKD